MDLFPFSSLYRGKCQFTNLDHEILEKSLGPTRSQKRILQVISRTFHRSNLTMNFYNAFMSYGLCDAGSLLVAIISFAKTCNSFHPILLFQLNRLILHEHHLHKQSISAEIPGIYSILSLLCKDEKGTCQLEATLGHLGSFSKKR